MPLRVPITLRLDETPEDARGLIPQRTVAPLVSFPAQPHMGRTLKRKLRSSQVGDLLHSGAGVVKEQEQRAIAQSETAVVRKSSEKRLDFLT